MIAAVSVILSSGGKPWLFVVCPSCRGGAATMRPVGTALRLRTARAVRERRVRGQKPHIGVGGRGGKGGRDRW